MAVSRGEKQYVRPRIVEVKPLKSYNTTPSPPPSPKAVRFAPTASRQITSTEHWSLWHFENHARICVTCYDPLAIYLRNGQLCSLGHDLAQDVAVHVYHKAGEIYSTEKDKQKDVRVELPQGFDQVRRLLKGMEYRLRSSNRPIISYDQHYPVSPRLNSAAPMYNGAAERREVIIEPATTSQRTSTSKSKSKSKSHKSTYPKATVIQEADPEPEPAREKETQPRERRGSLYRSDRQRKEKNYHVEEREPDWERRRKEERRRSGFWS